MQETLYHKVVNTLWAWLTGASTVYVLDIMGVWFVNTIGAMATALCVSFALYHFQNWMKKKYGKNIKMNNDEQGNIGA